MKFFLDSVGCRLNQAEIEQYAAQLIGSGHELVADPTEADVTIINTCSVTGEAASDSRQKLRQAARGGRSFVAATGCLVTLDPNNDLFRDPRVLHFPNKQKERIVMLLGERLGFKTRKGVHEHPGVPGKRKRTRAFIKAQDGCEQHCTYCITRLARGRAHSNPIEEVIETIRAAERVGIKEAVLCGVQLGAWGCDLTPKMKISSLIKEILKQTSIPRLRLSSIEPWNLDEGFFHLWENERLCRQLHLPLQSGSGRILKLMGRKNTPEDFRLIVENARDISPRIAITTDIMVGFPGESEEDLTLTEQFLREIQFAGGHVFSYSARPNTAAAGMASQIPLEIKKERNRRIRQVLSQLKNTYYQSFLNQQLSVLWEETRQIAHDKWYLEGWTDNYIRVRMECEQDFHNEITPVKLIRIEAEMAIGMRV